MAEEDEDHAALARRSTRVVWRVVGLVVCILGLFFFVAGVTLGVLEYNSPEQQLVRQGMSVAAQQLGGTIQVEGEGSVTITPSPYHAPGVSSYVAGEPATWLGFTGFLVGLVMFGVSFTRDSGGHDDAAPSADEKSQACLPEPASDEPFDFDE
jgi:hypothetical protein